MVVLNDLINYVVWLSEYWVPLSSSLLQITQMYNLMPVKRIMKLRDNNRRFVIPESCSFCEALVPGLWPQEYNRFTLSGFQ